MSFNILHGRAPSDGEVDPGRLVDAVRDLRPDVLALQEVDCDQPRSGSADFTALAAEAMGAVASRFVAAIAGTPGEIWSAATGAEQPGAAAYGVALLSRAHVETWRIVRLPRLRLRTPVVLGGRRVPRLVVDEPRVGVAAVLRTAGGALTVATTHLSFVPGWNALQLLRLRRVLTRLPTPRVVMGDLNMDQATARRVTGWQAMVSGATYPSDRPRVQLDHVLGDGPVPRIRAAQVVELPLSDHRAVVVDVDG